MRAFAIVLGLLMAAGASAQTMPDKMQDIPLPPGTRNFIADTSMSFEMVPRANADDAFEIDLQQDGHGSYRLTNDPQQAWREIHVSKPVIAIIERGSNAVDNQRCETKLKNIAKTGKKTISFVLGPSSPRQCEFDYSDDQDLNAAAEAFQAIAETIRMGEQLKHSLRYDRLGLDAEMDSLVEAVKAGHAIEVQNIAPVLQSLVDDDRVMERVKRKAAHLLEGAGIAVKNYTPEPSAR